MPAILFIQRISFAAYGVIGWNMEILGKDSTKQKVDAVETGGVTASCSDVQYFFARNEMSAPGFHRIFVGLDIMDISQLPSGVRNFHRARNWPIQSCTIKMPVERYNSQSQYFVSVC